jgi:hypothetical protein
MGQDQRAAPLAVALEGGAEHVARGLARVARDGPAVGRQGGLEEVGHAVAGGLVARRRLDAHEAFEQFEELGAAGARGGEQVGVRHAASLGRDQAPSRGRAPDRRRPRRRPDFAAGAAPDASDARSSSARGAGRLGARRGPGAGARCAPLATASRQSRSARARTLGSAVVRA